MYMSLELYTMSYNMLCIILHGELYKVLGLYIDTMVDLKSEAIMEMEKCKG